MDKKKLKEALTEYKKKRLKGQSRSKYHHKVKDTKFLCEICEYHPEDKSELHMHRIVPYGEYDDINVIIVCESCHRRIHRILRSPTVMNIKGEMKYHIAIKVAQIELINEIKR